ncbi:hypothetical protein NPIL_33951 [Nephila pilipes]|uniref:Uncharacterized protein n=1 Tax=Nephila pilipes TaxID=299642 RepID=A0A8X6TUE1_NEPPI|nr:hypothetical protein NPIL_33951 [Nephila pilipes]
MRYQQEINLAYPTSSILFAVQNTQGDFIFDEWKVHQHQDDASPIHNPAPNHETIAPRNPRIESLPPNVISSDSELSRLKLQNKTVLFFLTKARKRLNGLKADIFLVRVVVDDSNVLLLFINTVGHPTKQLTFDKPHYKARDRWILQSNGILTSTP